MTKDPTSEFASASAATLEGPQRGAAPHPHDTAFFGHPRGLSTLFFTEMWERFSYYGMRALLVLFMTAPVAIGGLGFDVAKAGIIYGTYTSLVYMVGLPGGWLADRIFGQQRAVLYGGVLIMLGHISLAIPGLTFFYIGLALIVLGTGLLKPNISAMVGQLYAPDDVRRDAGFSLFYMGINLGALAAPLVTGLLAQSAWWRNNLESWGWSAESSWHWGFAAAAVGMFFGLVQYVVGRKNLGEAGLHPAPATAEQAARDRRTAGIGVVVAVALFGVLALLAGTGMITLTAEGIGQVFGWVLGITVVGFFAWLFLGGSWTPAERKQLVVILVLFIGAAVFWSAFEQAGSTMNLFAEHSTRNEAFGIPFPASWFQSANSLYIILLAPVFAWLWVRLGKRDPSSPAKFTLGLIFLGLGFFVLAAGARAAANGVQVSPLWLAATYLLHTIGELCLSPVGLSAMTRLAPARVAGLMMGVWFLASSVGNYIGGLFATVYETFSLPTLFSSIGIYAFAAALLLGLLIRPINRMMARTE